MAITADKLLDRPSELHRRYGGRLAMQKSLQEKMVGGGPANVVLTKKSIKNIDIIKVKVIQIENILKGTVTAEKKALDEKKRKESSQRRESQEEKLETKPNIEKGNIKMPTAPKMGILDWIKNFIGNVLLGYFAVRLIKHLPKIMTIVKFLGTAADFLIDTGGKLLNGLATFIDWGYKAYDATRGFLKNFGGEGFAKGFDKFIGVVDTALFLTSVLAADLAVEAISGGGDGGGLGDIIGDQLKRRGAQQAATSAAGQAGGAAQAGGLSAGAVAGIVAGAGLLASALGEGAFQVRKVIVKPIQNLEKAYNEDRNPLTKIGRGIALATVRPLYGLFSTVGFLLDVVGAPFRYAIELLRYPFLSEEDKVKQANNLAKFDSRIREDLRKALNMLTLGLAFKEKGSFGNIYGNKGAQKEMMGKMAGGGITRGGKAQTGARRTIGGDKTKGKYKRELARKPSKVQVKDKDKSVKETTEQLDKTKYFGPILAISSKIIAKEEPTQKDYENVGLGLNLLISKGIEEKQLKGGLIAAFAEGGMVDSDFLEAAEKGADISSWISTTFKSEFETNAQKTLRLIREKKEEKEKGTKTPQASPDGIPLGEGETASGRALMQGLIQRGFTKEEASAIVGNLWAESGFRTTAVNPSSGAFGLMQWLGGRKSRLYSYAAEQNKQVTDANLQLDYIKWELKGGNAYETAQFQKAMAYGPDVASKTRGFAEQVERAGAGELRSSMSKRVGAAESVYGGRMVAGETPSIGPLGTGKASSVDQFNEIAKKYGLSLTSSYRAGDSGYHGKNRARDYSNDAVGNGTPEQLAFAKYLIQNYGSSLTQLIYTPLGFGIANGKKVGLDYWGPSTNAIHYHHVHVALAKGGRVRKPTFALIGEKGPEFVFDADTTSGLDRLAPGILEKLNIAKTKPQLASVLQSYADYEQQYAEPQIIEVPVEVPVPMGMDSYGSSGPAISFVGGGDDPFDTLYQGG